MEEVNQDHPLPTSEDVPDMYAPDKLHCGGEWLVVGVPAPAFAYGGSFRPDYKCGARFAVNDYSSLHRASVCALDDCPIKDGVNLEL